MGPRSADCAPWMQRWPSGETAVGPEVRDTDAPAVGWPKLLPTTANPLPSALAENGAYDIAASPSGFGDMALWLKMAMFVISVAAICSGAAMMHPIAALITGSVAGVLTTFTVGLLENVLKIDDALACFVVHGACGIWGVIATALFGAKALGGHPVYGLETADWLPQLGIQIAGALAIAVFTALAGYALFWVLRKAKVLRVPRDAELLGLDIALHKTYAYAEDMADTQWGR